MDILLIQKIKLDAGGSIIPATLEAELRRMDGLRPIRENSS
jgi:hypothetical protein